VILHEIDSGRLRITPFERGQVGVASIDLTLGDEIRVILPGDEPIEIREETDYRDHTRVERLDAPFVLDPGITSTASPASGSSCRPTCAAGSKGAVASRGSG
jgi:deoxycytidine triphosphate deaminase